MAPNVGGGVVGFDRNLNFKTQITIKLNSILYPIQKSRQKNLVPKVPPALDPI